MKKFKNKKLLAVGFEPTRPKPVDLKSTPLDHSGTLADNKFSTNQQINKSTNQQINKSTNQQISPPLGFEPRTSRLTAARSDQLSYRGIIKKSSHLDSNQS